jgi:hypothetical protein
MLTLLSRYMLHSVRAVRAADVLKEFAASTFCVVPEDHDANYFETSATRRSVNFQNPNK